LTDIEIYEEAYIISFCTWVCAAMTVSASAQVKKVVADKIVGQVGDKIILQSDIKNAMDDIKRNAAGQENIVLPTECQVMEGQLIRKALILQAQKDSVHISDDELDATWITRSVI
jgi:peptidyl-prolyl cis-trans isomerase SurA